VATRSRSFDRAAPFYDQTRGLPAAAMVELTDLLAAELVGRGCCVEIGVGTGRIALPLHEAGVELAGVDLARAMMAVLIEKAGAAIPFPLVQADATALPLRSGSCGAGLASHVFHLIPEWRVALDELVRVVRPGGLVLSSTHTGREAGSTLQAVRRQFRAEVGGGGPGHPGAEHADLIEQAFGELGARGRWLPTVHAERATTVATLIDGLEAGHWSWTWDRDPHVLRDAGRTTRAWAETEYGDLDAPIVVETDVRWRAFDLP
jgi:SAM-dependent methyltransferase